MSELLLISQNTEFVGLWFSKRGPWATSISVTRELFTNTNSQAPSRPSKSETERVGPTVCVSISPPGDPEAPDVWEALL